MKPPPLYFFIFFLLYSSLPLSAQFKKPLSGKEPSWVTIRSYDLNTSFAEQDAEDGFLNLVFEKQISVSEKSIYVRKSMKVLSEAGIENISEISVSFDPTYQQLFLHTINIVRNNKVISQLNLAKIKTIQRETELDKHLYDGSLTAVLFLEDLRKGDIVEYSYTIKGFNPVFKGKFSYTFDLNFRVPVTHIYYKLLIPKEKAIVIKNYTSTIQPEIRHIEQTINYEWKLENVPALRSEDNSPSWYDAFSSVLISEYKNWKEVNDWAMELFPPVKSLSPALQDKIIAIQKTYPSIEQQVIAALQFVQDEVRYMGIEVGENSHRPAHPNKIFAQRFGDCKDKTYLFCTMLHAMNIEASPVLINTWYKKTITEWLPAANIFDHVTVRANINGKYYWFDPTISYQRGTIRTISYPDYQYGLVVDTATTGLTRIEQKEPGMVKVREEFTIPDMSGAASLKVTTHYSGSFADETRSSFHNNSRYEMQKTYREFYAGYYEGITTDTLTYQDNDSSGIFTTIEYYSIKNLWELKNGVKKVYFYPFVIDGIIKKPKDTKRKMPFAMTYPALYEEKIVINTPSDWSVEESKEYIDNDAFKMKATYAYSFRKLTLLFEYEALQDHIPAEKTQRYLDDLKKKEEHFSYYLSNTEKDATNLLSESKKDKPNTPVYIAMAVLLGFAGFIWLAYKRK